MILGITGTIGAGKGTVVDYLTQKGFAHYSVRDFLLQEIENRGLPPDRDSMRTVANQIRAQHEPEYIIKMMYEQAVAEGGDALLESVRAIGEAEFLMAHGVLLLAVDADRRVRYERIRARGLSTDNVDFDTWVEQERKELTSTDPSGQNVIGVMLKADYLIENDGTLDELHAKIDEMLDAIETRE